jgi:hypothetical protein
MNSTKSALAFFEQNISANGTNRSNSKSFLGNIVNAINNERLPDDMTETSVSGDSAPYSLRHDVSEASFLEMMEMIDIAHKVEAVEQMASLTEGDVEDTDEVKQEDEQVEHQINKAEASSDESDEAEDERGLMLTWDEQRQLLMTRDRKPQQDIGGSVSLKDRMRAFNAPSFSILGAATESPRVRSSSMRATTTAAEESLETKVEKESRANDSEDTSHTECAIPEVEPAVQRTSISPEVDSEDKYGDDYKYVNDFVEQDGEKKAVEHQTNKSSDHCGEGKGLLLSWEEQLRILTAKDRKPQQDIGGSVSLKDRMRAFNAKCA